MRKYLFLIFTLILLFWYGCTTHPEQASLSIKTQHPPAQPRTHYSIFIDNYLLKVEVADTPEKRSRGLQFRDELPENQGMIFIFETPQILQFWMKNTSIPLSIAFINEQGKVIDIQDMQPLDISQRYVSPAVCKYALEVNQGWFEQRGISSGVVIEGLNELP